MSNLAQRSFTAGEVAPSLYGRVDAAAYQDGLRQCRNFIVQKHGGVANRPGTGFIKSVKNPANPGRLIPFIRDADTAYMLEFGDKYFRVVQNGAYITIPVPAAWVNAHDYAFGDFVSQGGVNYVCIQANTSNAGTNKPGVDAAWPTYWYALTGNILEYPSPYAATDLNRLQYAQVIDEMTIVHRLYLVQKLVRTSSTLWQLAPTVFGPIIGTPGNLNGTGGAAAAGAITYWAVTAVDQNSFEESLPAHFSHADMTPSAAHPVNLTWDAVSNALYYNVYRSLDGQSYGFVGKTNALQATVTDSAWTTQNAVADATTAVWTPAAGPIDNPLAAVSATAHALDGNYDLHITGSVAGQPGSVGAGFGRIDIFYSRDGEAPVLCDQLFYSCIDDTQYDFDITRVLAVPDNGYSTLEITAMPYAQTGGQPGNEVITSLHGVDVEWQGRATGWADVGSAPDQSIAPPQDVKVFASPGDFPGAVTRFQQRALFSGSINEPNRARGSRIGSPGNFTSGLPIVADDPIDFVLDGKRSYSVRHFLDLQKLIIMTDSGEIVTDGLNNSGILQPDAINSRGLSYHGSGFVDPVIIGDRAVYLQARSNQVRSLKIDDVQGSVNTDLSLYAAHLFNGYSIVDAAFAQIPNNVLWMVRSDGILLGLTYLPELNVFGWHRHDTLGFVENVAVVPEGIEDVLYMIVRRVINGATVRYVERMASRYFTPDSQGNEWFVDAGAVYDGTNTSQTGMYITGGVKFDETETLDLNATAAYFQAGDVGDAIFLNSSDGVTQIIFTIESYTSNVLVHGHINRVMPSDLGGPTTNWIRAKKTISGLDHLNGQNVSVFADSYVVASPNNDEYGLVTVAGGSITLDRPYGKVLAGLPYICDVETLDIDTGRSTIKNKRILVSGLTAYFENTRGVWAGQFDQVSDEEPLNNLQEFKTRDLEDYYQPNSLVTDSLDVDLAGRHNTNGRVLVRQVDPLPVTLLMLAPSFDTP